MFIWKKKVKFQSEQRCNEMESFNESMEEYRKQLQKGSIQKAYLGLMEYFGSLRSYFSKKHSDYGVSNLYFGYMDMTYFALFPKALKELKLKIAIVFLHEEFRFEVWLSATNKDVQTKYWNLVKEKNWNKYNIAPVIKGYESIIEDIIVDNPNFNDLDSLTNQIESKTLHFIDDVEGFLSKY